MTDEAGRAVQSDTIDRSIGPVVGSYVDSILQINQASLPGVVALSRDAITRIMNEATIFHVVNGVSGVHAYIIAYSCDDKYNGEEFDWLKKSVAERFLYIDQIAVASAHRGQGVGSVLYEFLASYAVANGFVSLTCEVNLMPPNPKSLQFHRRLGFAEIGGLGVSDGREVLLMKKSLQL